MKDGEMDALLLMLLDSRSPAGAHHHSAAMEPAVTHGLVRDLDDVSRFCQVRLHTTGVLVASFAAAACARSADPVVLEQEYVARLPSGALREQSLALGRGLLRLVRAMRPDLEIRFAHHPLVLGAAVRGCGGTPRLAALAAALATCTAPAGAAVRLLGLDPLATQAMLTRLAPQIDEVAEQATQLAAVRAPQELPAHSVPALDLLADVHSLTEVRLFAS